MEISIQMFNWLKDSGVVSGRPQQISETVVLNDADSERLELGLILPLISQFSQSHLPDQDQFKTVNSKVARLNNWNLLMKPLEALNVKISSDVKALIVAGDRQQVAEVLFNLFQSIYLLIKKKPLKASFEGGLLLDNLKLNHQLVDSESVLEFFVLSFCKSFKTSAKVSAGLLAQNGSFLAQLVKKGLKRDFSPVLLWFETIESFLPHLSVLIEREKKSLKLVLSSLKHGLSSNSEKVIEKSVQILGNMRKLLAKHEEECLKWFLDDSDSLTLSFKLIEKKIEVTEIVELIVLFTKKNLLEPFGHRLKDYCKKGGKYLELIQKIMKAFKEIDVVSDIFQCGLVRNWIDLCLNNEGDNFRNNDPRACYLSFLCDTWKFFFKHFESQEELSNNILTFVKRVIRDGSRVFKILTFGRLFDIFVTFTQEKNAYAPILYKTLIFGLVENYHDERLREFMFLNFIQVFNDDLSIPLSILIEPLVKQALILKHLNFQVFDFDFYIYLGRSPKLSLKDAILIIDLCCKAITSDSVYSKTAEIPFMIISARFIEQRAYQDYLSKFISFLIKLRIGTSPKPEDFESAGRNLNLVEKIIRFNQYELNEKIKEILNYLVPDIRRTKDKRLEILFKAVFDPFRSLALPMQDVPLKSDSFIVSSLNSIPHTRVTLELEKIKQKKLLKEYKEKVEIEQKSLQNILQRKALKHEINKRRVELGVNSRVGNDEKVFVAHESYSKDHGFELLRISEEPEEISSLIKTVLKRYTKVTRTLFNKYAGFSYKKKGSMTPTFEKYQKIKEILNEGDFSILLRDFSLIGSRVTVEEMKRLFFTLAKKSGHLEFEDFPDLLYMTSRLIALKDLPTFAKFPEALHLQFLFEYLRDNCEGVLPRFYFTDPDFGYGDRDIAKALNEKLEQNPHCSLPNNYKKYKETILVVKYEPFFGKKSKKIAVKVLDDLLCHVFGFHFLMPIVEKQEKIRAKGLLRHETHQKSLRSLSQIESHPGFGKLPGHLKLHAIQMTFDEDITLECSKLLDDLIFSLEKNSFVLISRYPKPAGKLTNRVIQERQMIEFEKQYQSERAEERRKARAKKLEVEVEKIKLEKEYQEFKNKEEKKKALIEAKFHEKIRKKEWDRKKFEIDEKILEFKLNKLEKQMNLNNSENFLPRVKADEMRVNQSYDYKRHDSRDLKKNDSSKPRSGPRVFNRFFKK